ncbi:MAG: hypothetical protein ACHQF0_17090 [Chitinophagales bacterium]
MSSYRLLRSNNESGPYSLNDLLTLGLKPYDLIWIEGRSAAWRYPSEVSELKEYAPVVEEQPYDRFFKKPSESENLVKEKTHSLNSEPVLLQKKINEDPAKAEPVQEIMGPEKVLPKIKKNIPEIRDPAHQAYQPQPNKKVFVSLPETNGFDPYSNTYQEEKYEQYLPKPKPIPQQPVRAEEKSYSPINIQESGESKLETKYTQSLDDIKEMYVNTLVQRKTKNRRKEIVKRYVKPALLPLLLVIAGVAIGYFITSKKNSLQVAQSVSKVISPQTIPEQKSEDPLDQNNLQPGQKQNSVSSTDSKIDKPIIPAEEKHVEEKTGTSQERDQQKKTTQPQKGNNSIAAVSKTIVKPVKEKETFIPSNETSAVPKKDIEVDPTTGERKSVVRDNNDAATVTNNVKTNTERLTKKNNPEPTFLEDGHKDIHDLISVKSNNYIRGTFGGIRGLELTVYNNSNYLIDEVSVELQIMKPSEEPLRTDIITFRNISANGTVTVKIPDSQRGIRVDYRITNIESKQWQKSTAGL